MTNKESVENTTKISKIMPATSVYGCGCKMVDFAAEQIKRTLCLSSDMRNPVGCFQARVDEVLRKKMKLPEREKGGSYFDFDCERRFVFQVKNSILKLTKRLSEIPDDVKIDWTELISEWEKCMIEPDTASSEGTRNTAAGKSPMKGEAAKTAPKKEEKHEDKDDLLSSEDGKGIKSRDHETMDVVEVGKRLHGTMVCRRTRSGMKEHGVIFTGSDKTFCLEEGKAYKSAGKWETEVHFDPERKRGTDKGKIYKKPASLSVAMLEGEMEGVCGPLSAVLNVLGAKSGVGQWVLDPDHIGTFKELADEIAKNPPKLAFGYTEEGHKYKVVVVGEEEFSAETKGRILTAIVNSSGYKFSMSLFDWSRNDPVLVNKSKTVDVRVGNPEEKEATPTPENVTIDTMPSMVVEIETLKKEVEARALEMERLRKECLGLEIKLGKMNESLSKVSREKLAVEVEKAALADKADRLEAQVKEAEAKLRTSIDAQIGMASALAKLTAKLTEKVTEEAKPVEEKKRWWQK